MPAAATSSNAAFLTRPLAIHGNLALLYDFDYRQPVRHYRLGGVALEFVTAAVRGRYRDLAALPQAIISQLPGLEIYPLSARMKGPLDAAVVDGSIGGPSMLASHVARRQWVAGRRCLLLSYHRREALFDGEPIALPAPFNKFTFIHWTRAMLQILQPSRLLIVGREVAAKLFDLFPQIPTTIIETGFAEGSLVPDRVSESVLDRALREVLFRCDTYPWDSVAHNLTAAAAIREATLNVVLSEDVRREIATRFPDAAMRFMPPSVDLGRFRSLRGPADGPLRVLLCAGTHSLGNSGRNFLAVQTLIDAAAQVAGCEITILTVDPERMQTALGNRRHVRILPRVPWEDMPTVLADHNVYYRVQNDQSLPTSCLEAMAMGLPVILNERATAAFSGLRHGDNVFCVPFADIAALTTVLTRLDREPELRQQFGMAGAQMVWSCCDLDVNLREIGWSNS